MYYYTSVVSLIFKPLPRMSYIIGIIVIAVVAIGFTLTKNGDIPPSQTEVATSETVTRETSGDAVATITDGTHSTSVTYFTPARNEYLLDVTLITENGIITDANVAYSQGAEKDPNAQRFEAAYKEVVIGQSISDLEVSRVGGASLTSAAFNEALAKIRSEA